MGPGTILFVTLVLSTAVLAQAPASALPIDNTRWCAVYGGHGGGGTNCGFFTWQQCMATVTGIGGFCEPNQFYNPGPASAPANSTRTSNRLQTRFEGELTGRSDRDTLPAMTH